LLAKHGFARLSDTARTRPVVIEKRSCSVVLVLAVEEFERLETKVRTTIVSGETPPTPSRDAA
jgi:hypothetical protein